MLGNNKTVSVSSCQQVDNVLIVHIQRRFELVYPRPVIRYRQQLGP